MKQLIRTSLALLFLLQFAGVLLAQTTVTLQPLASFGSHGDGSIRPGDSIGTSPFTGNNVQISAPGGYGIQPGDLSISTNGNNMRGLAYDPITKHLVFLDTHNGGNASGGGSTNNPNGGLYILDGDSGQIIGELSTNGIVGGTIGTYISTGVADDGVIYAANQINKGSGPFKLYRWPNANPSSPDFSIAPAVAFSNSAPSSVERMATTIAVRGAGTNTQILACPVTTKPGIGGAGTGTNLFLFTTTDGTNFVHHQLYVPNLVYAPGFNSGGFQDGIAFGPGNSFFAKEVGQALYFIALPGDIDQGTASTNACTMISYYVASGPNDPLLNLSALAADNANHLLAGMEEIGGTATAGNGKVWLYDFSDPTNRPPAVLAPRVYPVNFAKTLTTMGFLAFGNGRLYAEACNNGFLVNTVQSTTLVAPSYSWTDYNTDGSGFTRVSDLPATTRAAVGQSAHFEVFAVPGVTNYQWYSNSVPIANTTGYYLNVPNVQPSNSNDVFQVVAFNAAGSATSTASTLQVIDPADFFHPSLRWSFVAGATNYITSTGGAGSPNERCIAYNSLSNQLLVVRGAAFNSLNIFVVDAETGQFLYTLKTNGMVTSVTLPLCGIGVAQDGAVYAASVCSASATDQSFKVYRWADTGPNTLPVAIFGTNSSAGAYNSSAFNPVTGWTGDQMYRFGDNLDVHGAGNDTEIIVDSQNSAKFAGILRPVPDGSMTNWTATAYVLQNTIGSYGYQAYGTVIGRSLQFGPIRSGPLGDQPTFWQKRYNGSAGAPLAGMGYGSGQSLAALDVGNSSLPLFTNGPAGISFSLKVAAAINFAYPVTANNSAPDTLDYYDLSDESQAVLLYSEPLPGANGGGHKINNNAIGQVVFGYNPATGSNYLFAIDGNNGIAAFYLSGGVIPPPKLLVQPQNARVLQGNNASLSVFVDQVATVSWYKGTNAPVYTGIQGNSYTITNAQVSDGGDYFAIANNANGTVTSQVAHVTVSLPDDNFSLSPNWSANPTNSTFVSGDGGPNTPYERAFAYNALSNQLIVVHCPPGSSTYTVSVVDGTYGTNLYALRTDGVIHEGTSEIPGSNPIDLVAPAVADDGAVYICNLSPNASGGQNSDTTKMFHVYRWANSGSNTIPSVVFEGDPADQLTANERWGDVMAARGSGTNTELFLNSYDGVFGAVLRPTNSTLAGFTNSWFYDTAGAGVIGRSIQFGLTNTVYEKRESGSLFYSLYDVNAQNSTTLYVAGYSPTLGGVFLDSAHKLAAGVDFVGSTTAPLKPDAVALYDITDPSTPMFLGRTNFPVNKIANANFISQTVISGYRVYALDANNGLMAFYLNPPASSMSLSIVPAGSNVNLSWGNPDAVLQGTDSLSAPNWTDLTAPGLTNSNQPGNAGSKFYRLILRR